MASTTLPYAEGLPYAGSLMNTAPAGAAPAQFDPYEGGGQVVPTDQKQDWELAPAISAAPMSPYGEPIQRLFDPKDYINSLTSTSKQSKKEKKWLGALGHALQLGNPNFNPSSYLKDYETTQAAANQAQWDQLRSADQVMVEREAIKRADARGIDTVDQFGEALADWGIIGVDIRKRLIDDFKQFQPDRKLALDEIRAIRAMRATARSDIADLVKDPINRIKKIEDAVIKVRITTRTPTQADREWVRANYKISEIKSDDPDKESKGIRHIALINAYQRMIDPATVREGDVTLIQASASWKERLEIAFDRIMDGKFLTEGQITEMQRLADEFYFHTIRNNLNQVLGAREVLVSRYTGSTGSTVIKEKDIDSDFYSKVSESAVKKWQREFRKGQSMMKKSSQERPILIHEEEEMESYLPGTLIMLNGEKLKVK